MKTEQAFQELYRGQSPDRLAALGDAPWGDFLDHTTTAQALAWAAREVDLSEPPGEDALTCSSPICF